MTRNRFAAFAVSAALMLAAPLHAAAQAKPESAAASAAKAVAR